MTDDNDNYDNYEGEIVLAWEGNPPPDVAAVEETVRADIRWCLGGLPKPSDLIFHHVGLTEDDEGPSVMVFGKEGSDAFHCEYTAKTAWTTLSEEST